MSQRHAAAQRSPQHDPPHEDRVRRPTADSATNFLEELSRRPAAIGPAWWVLLIGAGVVVLAGFRAISPMTAYPGDIWRQSDTATIARNFARNGMDLFFPQ